MCSLNWADIYRYCAAGESDAQAIYDRLVRAYNQAEMFIQLTPAMPMPDLSPRSALIQSVDEANVTLWPSVWDDPRRPGLP